MHPTVSNCFTISHFTNQKPETNFTEISNILKWLRESWRGPLSKVTLPALSSLMKQQWRILNPPLCAFSKKCFFKAGKWNLTLKQLTDRRNHGAQRISTEAFLRCFSWILESPSPPWNSPCIFFGGIWGIRLVGYSIYSFACPSFPSLKSQACRTLVSLESRNGTNALRLESERFVDEAYETMWNDISKKLIFNWYISSKSHWACSHICCNNHAQLQLPMVMIMVISWWW